MQVKMLFLIQKHFTFFKLVKKNDFYTIAQLIDKVYELIFL